MAKRVLTSYILWFIGVCFHLPVLPHYYLERDLQGILWMCTTNCFFGFGLMFDLIFIPQYVACANKNPRYVRAFEQKLQNFPRPPFNMFRFAGMVLVGAHWSNVMSRAIPEDNVGGINWHWLRILVPAACALGVWAVGNVGHEQGSINFPIIVAYAIFPFYLIERKRLSTFTMALGSSYAFTTSSRMWNARTQPRKDDLRRILQISASVVLYLSLKTFYVMFNKPHRKIIENDILGEF